MQTMSAAEDLYKQICEGGVRLLEQWKLDGIGESSKLDFKLAEKRKPPLTKDDRSHLAEALSGFANSEGGVLVWGVDCRKVNGIDAIQELVPINFLKAFQSSIRSLCPQLCSPGVPGFDTYVLETDVGSDTGFVVCLIPPVDGPPVMALAQEQSCFFYRSIDTFLRMPHWMVERGFNQKRQPKLELVWRKQRHDYRDSTIFHCAPWLA